MSNKVSVSTVKITVLALLVMSLLLVPACKKSTSKKDPNSGETACCPADETVDQADVIAQAKADADETPTADTSGMILLPTELPRPMFIGTPKPVRVSNLAPVGKKRAPFYVPEGTTNLARGKSIISSDPEPIIGEIEMITDGDKEAADGSNVELAPMPQHITIDLGAKSEIYAVLIWHFHKEARVYFDIVVQVADDPDFITNVKTLFNNDDDNSAGLGIGSDQNYVETNEGKLVDAKGVQARYVRLYSNGSNANEMNHYIEVEVFGKNAK